MIIDTVMARTAAFCKRWDMLPAGCTVLCAVSGGRDSMALLHILRRLAQESGASGIQIAAAHFNHQLRPAAERDEAFVRHWCQAHGIPFYAGRGDVRSFAAQSGTGLEDAARTQRYRFLEETATAVSAGRIATAHHCDDNAETVLLHLLRGTGPQGLCGIPPVRGHVIRPLLEISRQEINEYIAEHQIPYREDETNADPAYTRNRIRLEVLPLLEQIAPSSTRHIASAAALLRDEDTHLQAETDALLPPAAGEEIVLPVPVLSRQDAALRRRLVRTMALRLGVTLTRRQTESVLSLASGKVYRLPGGVQAVRLPHQLVVRRIPELPPPLVLRVGRQFWGPWEITLHEEAGPVEECPDTVVLDASAGPLTAAAWDGTGRLRIENGSRTLKRLFQDCGIPAGQRHMHPVLFANGKPAAVLGAVVDWELRPREGQGVIVVRFVPSTGKEPSVRREK